MATAGMVVGSNGTAAACTSTVARNADGVAASVLAPWPSVECWRPCCPTLHRRFTIYRRQTFSHRPTKPRRRPFIPHLDIHRASIIHRGETLTPRTESRDNRTARNTRYGGTYPAPKGTRQACERGPLAALGMSQLGLSPGRPGRRERQDDPRDTSLQTLSRRGPIAPCSMSETSRAVGALLVMRAMLESALEVRGRGLRRKSSSGVGIFA